MNPKLEKVSRKTDKLLGNPKKGAGCCLHIVIEDCNIEDHHVELCLKQAKKAGKGHKSCRKLARRYKALTKAERAVVLNMGWCVGCEDYSCCGICHECGGALDPVELTEEGERCAAPAK